MSQLTTKKNYTIILFEFISVIIECVMSDAYLYSHLVTAIKHRRVSFVHL